MASELRQATLTKNYTSLGSDIDLNADLQTLIAEAGPSIAPSASMRVVWIYVGATGDIAIQGEEKHAPAAGAIFKAVPVGTFLWIAARKILASGSTVTNITVGWAAQP